MPHQTFQRRESQIKYLLGAVEKICLLSRGTFMQNKREKKGEKSKLKKKNKQKESEEKTTVK